MHHHRVHNRRRYQWTYVAGAVAIASAVGGLIQPAIAGAEAEWDIGAYESCFDEAAKRIKPGDESALTGETIRCCVQSGGEWNSPDHKCEAPPATAQQWPQGPLGQLPGTGPAAQVPNAPQSPLGQVPGAGQATQTPTTPPPRMGTLNLP